ELADRLHLLGIAKQSFGLLPRGHVTKHQNRALRRAPCGLNRATADDDVNYPGLAPDAKCELKIVNVLAMDGAGDRTFLGRKRRSAVCTIALVIPDPALQSDVGAPVKEILGGRVGKYDVAALVDQQNRIDHPSHNDV